MRDIAPNTKNLEYPAKHHNLLIKAGLIGTGEKVIMGSHNNELRISLNEGSNTWEKTKEYTIDHRNAKGLPCPAITEDGRILGDWRIGLLQADIKIINEECGVPIYSQNSMIPIYSGKRYDLQNPKHVAEYKVLMETSSIAIDRERMLPGQRFYIFSPEKEAIKKEKARASKRAAIKLDADLGISEKLELLRLISATYELGYPYEMSHDEVKTTFGELAYEGEHLKVLRTYQLPNKHLYILAYKAIQCNALNKELDEKISSPTGVVLADDMASFVQLLAGKESLRKELTFKISRATSQLLTEKATNTHALDLGLVTTYHTGITSEEDVKYWNTQACLQYVKEKGWITTLKETSGEDKWQELVIDIHKEQKSKWGHPLTSVEVVTMDFSENGNQPQSTPLDNFPNGSKTAPTTRITLERDESGQVLGKKVEEVTKLALTGEKEALLVRVNNWQRDQCKNFLLSHADVVEQIEFTHTVKPQSGFEKWRNVVKEFINRLSEEQIIDMLS